MLEFFSSSFAVVLTSFVLAFMLTAWVRSILLRRCVLDVPNERSSHINPVPRGGGWALMIVLLPALVLAAAILDGDLRHFGLIAALFLLVFISWVDDQKHVSPFMRLSMHLLAVCLGTFSFASDETLFAGHIPFWLDRTIMILGWTWFVNLYNFMDGIDGITGVETVSIALGLVLVSGLAKTGDPFVRFTLLILIGASFGFLFHNWHPAKIFLGDVGSVPLGYLVGFCLLTVAVRGAPWAALILPLYYLADSGITIAKRALRKEKIWQAHREHYYQKAAAGIGAHSPVVLLILLANGGLIVAAAVSVYFPLSGLAAGFLIVGILLRMMHKRAS